jgi:hypothetical protein
MIATEDFTCMPEGTFVLLEGRIKPCPSCGRNGIEHQPEELAPYFVHRQSTEMHCDGLRVELEDSCPEPAEPS